MSTAVRRLLIISILLVALLACNLPIFSPNANPGVAGTAAAQTVAAVMSQAATAPQPNVSPIPTLGVIDTFTPLPTFSPIPNVTATSNVPLVSVSIATNCRVGPGKAYTRVGALLVGVKAEVYGRTPKNDYWYIRNPDNPAGYCWVWGEYATLEGNVDVLPIVTPPPSPTPMPEFLIGYLKTDSCAGWWLEFLLTNSSPTPFESYSITVRDMVTDVELTSTSDNFKNLNGCLSTDTIPRIDGGDSFVLSAPAFAADPKGHKIKASLTLCTEDSLDGICVTNSLTFKAK